MKRGNDCKRILKLNVKLDLRSDLNQSDKEERREEWEGG